MKRLIFTDFRVYLNPNRKKRIFRVDILDPDNETYTYMEDQLEVGEKYLFRVEAHDRNTGIDGAVTRKVYRSINYLGFIVPDPDVHYTCEWLTLYIEEANLKESVKRSLVPKLEICDESSLNDFIEQVRSLRGKKIPRWLADILMQCAEGVIEKL